MEVFAMSDVLSDVLSTRNPESYWSSIIAFMKEGALNPAAFSSWIAPLKPYKMDNDNFTLLAKDEHIKNTVTARYLGKISGAFRAVFGQDYKVHIILESEIDKIGQVDKERQEINLKGTNLRPKFHFDSFVKGKSNEFAYAAAQNVAENPGIGYNPLFIYGGVGLGKTHLMHSIGNHILENNSNAKILYTTSENLVNDFVNAIRNKTNQEFRDKYRQVDVLLVDDIQFLSDKEGTQEEFFHTFNTLHNDGKQIVLTADKPPLELQSIESRLRSRFASDLTVDISIPDFETRKAILQKKAEEEGMELESTVFDYIAKNIEGSVRELEGALKTVTARAKLTNSNCTVALAATALASMIQQSQRREVDVEYIQDLVSSFYNIPAEDLLSKKRSADITRARHVAMYFCRQLLDTPLKQLGKEFGGKDHSTVIHAVEKIATNLEKDKKLKEEVVKLEAEIKISMNPPK